MTKSHKKQHWVPRSYLKAWVDPENSPYVHIFNKDGKIAAVLEVPPSDLLAEQQILRPLSACIRCNSQSRRFQKSLQNRHLTALHQTATLSP